MTNAEQILLKKYRSYLSYFSEIHPNAVDMIVSRLASRMEVGGNINDSDKLYEAGYLDWTYIQKVACGNNTLKVKCRKITTQQIV